MVGRLLGLVLAGVLVAGCGSSGSDPGDAEVSVGVPSESATVPEGVPTGPPPEPPAEQANTLESAEEYVRFFVERYYYAYSVHDPDLLFELIADPGSPCGGCAPTEKNINRHERDGVYSVTDGSEIEVSEFQQNERQGRKRAVAILYDMPAGQLIGEQGNASRTPAEENVYLEVGLEWKGDRWEVWGFGFPN